MKYYQKKIIMNNNKLCYFCNKQNNFNIQYNKKTICKYCLNKINNKFNNISKTKNYKKFKLNSPHHIKKILDKYIIGQRRTKKTLSVAIYNHYKRLIYNNYYNNDKINIEKSNILIIGKTGTGKTLFARTISKILNLPFVIVDATVFTEAGYVGEDVENILTRLLEISNYNIELAEKGIVYIDEFDKLSRKSRNPSITRDVSGEGVQQSLLKFFENTIVYISPILGRKHPEQNLIPINTKNILFIVGGTFEGINNIIKNRIQPINKIGFNYIYKKKIRKIKNILNYLTIKDLQEYGIIPEIIGRLPVITYLNNLKKNDYKKILIKPKNSLIKQYIELLKMDNIKILIKESFINIIVKETIKLGLGARGLKNICEKIFEYISYNYINKEKRKVTIKFNKKNIKQILKKNEYK
ncbi:MAG: ATP-dependent Clp protease ATP-binding subunit ClpX [Candidatus Shikimatogenerans bostrichidophilus]|nr:MAG: ATP-dependent Clp protease ATP-binding subunit ClpX [Candidatus Shikimatogenerans bostrichidophilus]